jgi:hypothetical protein
LVVTVLAVAAFVLADLVAFFLVLVVGILKFGI